MRHFFVIFLVVGVAACGSRGGSSGAVKVDSAGMDSLPVASAPKTDQAPEVLPAFKKLDTVVPFAGVYVNADYVAKIRQNGSPRLDQDTSASCIKVPPRTLQVTRMVWGFHDGGADCVVLKDSNDYAFYSADLKHLMWTIVPVDSQRIIIGDKAFLKLQHPDTTKYDWGILEELMFAGKYLSRRSDTVVFTADGQVSGLGDYRSYDPKIDYSDPDARSEYDQIFLSQGPDAREEFGFRFAGDSLLLYTVEKWQGRERLAERRWTLVRLK
jgi:hypothetical protein